MVWDTRKIRKVREFGWFKQNEGAMIEAARRRRAAEEKRGRSQKAESLRLLHWRKCPKCGSDMALKTIEEIEVEVCKACEGIFFDRGELEELLLRHDAHRRGFFRRLLGFRKT